MNHIAKYLIITILGGVFVGCNDYSPWGYQPSIKAQYLYTNTSKLDFGSGMSTKSFDVHSTDTPWGITGMQSWISVDPVSGNNDASVSVSVTENPSADVARTELLTLFSNEADYDRSFRIAVTQMTANPNIQLTTESIDFPVDGGTKTVSVQANVSYEATSSKTWLTATVSSDKKTVTLKAEPNATAQSRTATVTLSGRVTETITVTQAAAGITTTQSSTLEAGQQGGTYQMQIKADAAWTATNNGYSWIEVTPTGGEKGTANVTLSVAANGSTSNRTGHVSFRIGNTTLIDITVNQKGLYLTPKVNSLTFDADACSRNLEVESNVTWKVLSAPSWVTISKDAVTGNKTLAVSVPNYNETTDRSGEIVLGVDGLNIQQTVKVVQKGRTFPNLVGTIQFDAKASTQSFDVTTDGSWVASSSETWLTLSKTSGKGNTAVNATVTENTCDAQRTAAITVSVGGSVQTILVTQASHYLTISPTTMAESLPSTGGSYKFSISSDDTWQATKKSSWLTLSATSGTGNVDITMTAADNPSINDRKDTVLITPAHGQAVRLVVQQSARYLRVKTREINFFYRGGESDAVEIETDGTYQITKEGDWFSVQQSGKSFTVTATENATADKRQGKVIITLTGLKEGESKTIEILVIQRSKTFGPDRDDFSEDEDWSIVIGDSHATISITRFGSDEDWNKLIR